MKKRMVLGIGVLMCVAPLASQASGITSVTVPAVSGVSIDREEGCGQPNPTGEGCPAVTTVSFTVPYGGTCHEYSLQVENTGSKALLTIVDKAYVACTRPEFINYSTSVELHGELPADLPVQLANPLAERSATARGNRRSTF